MLARRALAVTPDKDFAKTLKLALMAAGTVAETAAAVADLPAEVNADVVALHLPDNQLAPLAALLGRLAPKAWVIAILGKSELTKTVEVMQASDRVAGVLIAERFEPADLAATVTRLLHGDIFGLDKIVPWGTRIYSTLVGDYNEKSMCISQLSDFAATVGVRRKYREALEQCADEMLMNALYDAPVDASGKPLYAEVPSSQRSGIKVEQKAVVQYACDGSTFALSVRDAYGTFSRDILLRFLHKCLHSDQQIDRKAGGAGLGLYLMANNASTILFNVMPGVATEVICVFDIAAPKLHLEHIGLYHERVDASGRLATDQPVRVHGTVVERRRGAAAGPAAPSRALIGALTAAIALLVVLIGLTAYPRLVTQTGSLTVTTDPPGAIIEIDGRTRGSTEGGSLTVHGLEAGTGHRIFARLDGYADGQALIEVADDEASSLKLTLAPRDAIVTVESEPAGATVVRDGAEVGETPIALADLPAGKEVELTLRHPGYRETRHKVRVPGPGGTSTVSIALPLAEDLASVAITTTPAGATVKHNGQRIAGLVTPVDEYLVESGRSHQFTLELAGHMPATVEVAVSSGQRRVPVTAALKAGGSLVVRANVPARVKVSNTSVCKKTSLPLECPIENGRHHITLEGTDPVLQYELDVEVRGDEVRQDLQFGIVEAKDGFALQVRRGKAHALALAEGRQTVTVVGGGGDKQTLAIDVRPGASVFVP